MKWFGRCDRSNIADTADHRPNATGEALHRASVVCCRPTSEVPLRVAGKSTAHIHGNTLSPLYTSQKNTSAPTPGQQSQKDLFNTTGGPATRSLNLLRLPRASHETKIAQQHTAMDGESREERDARIKALWEQLDTKKKGTVDLPALKHGLTKMNHRKWEMLPA